MAAPFLAFLAKAGAKAAKKKGGGGRGGIFSAAGKGKSGAEAGLQAAAANQAQPLSGILGAHKNVATKHGIKRVKRLP